MLSDTANNYTFNAESQIKTAAGVTYTYDGDGDRVQKSSGTIYWYGAGTEILNESSGSGSFTDEYVYFGGKRIAHRDVNNNIYYYAEDLLGTTRTLLEAGQTSVCYDADFYPFGGERDVTTTCTQNFKFESKERDTETGNDDFGARYYTSRLGRWLSADWSAVPQPVPYANLTNPQTLNLYAMVKDNPETFADLNGHDDDSSGSGGDSSSGSGSGTTGSPSASTVQPDNSSPGANPPATQNQSAQNKPDPTAPPPPPTPDPAGVHTDPSLNPSNSNSNSSTTSSPADQTQAPMESRAHGKGERNRTGTTDETQNAKPIRDKDGKTTGWRLPTPDGKGKVKTLEWGTSRGLDPNKFQTAAKIGVIGAIGAAGAYAISTAPEWAPFLALVP